MALTAFLTESSTLSNSPAPTPQRTQALNPLDPQEKSSHGATQSLHSSSFLGLPDGILNINLIEQNFGTTAETIGEGLHLTIKVPLKVPSRVRLLQGSF